MTSFIYFQIIAFSLAVPILRMSLPSILENQRVILGSLLPRRATILSTNLGISKFEIIVSGYAEDLQKQGRTVAEYVSQTCQNKARDVESGLNGEYVLICCDTVIDCDGSVCEKPRDGNHQREMLHRYRQLGSIKVISAVTVISCGRRITKTCTTRLNWNDHVTDEIIEDYINSGEGNDAAGGFKFQERGLVLFDSIEGDYFNVVGLPVATTYDAIVTVTKK